MQLPSLYKYLSPDGAKLTLGNGTFRHAKPSDFNDDMDMTIQKIFPDKIEKVLGQLAGSTARLIFENLDKRPTCLSDNMRHKVTQLQTVFRANHEAINIIERKTKANQVSDLYDAEHMQNLAKNMVAELNGFLQNHRVLCVSDDHTSIPMWERYAADHSGIILRITPNENKNSKFQLFRKVGYTPTRPTLYESTRKFQEDSLFGDQEKTKRDMLDNIIYTKTKEWEYEREYRLAIPLGPGEEYETLPYQPEEISELFLGAKMDNNEKEQILELAQKMNPRIQIFQTSLNADGCLVISDL